VTEAKIIPWTTRLSKVIRQPGGTTAGGAVKDARRNLETIRLECIAEIDGTLRQIQQNFGQAVERPNDAELEELYRCSNEIVGIAGVFDLTELGEAAFSLCELLDRMKLADQWDWPAVEMHLAGLRLLRRAEPGQLANQQVLDGLRQLTARVDVRREAGKA
jgi:hypothetical protein